MPKDREAFVESQSTETGSRRAQRISLKVTEEGTIDWDSASEKQKQQFAELVANDATALEMIGLKAGEGEAILEEGGGAYVKPEHVVMFLDLYAKGSAFLIPKIIKKKSKGIVCITPEMASEAFAFTEEQKAEMGQPGAEWANEAIPESWRKWLTENIGPGLKFVGLLAMATAQQTQMAVEMWKKKQGVQDGVATVAAPTNGHAATQEAKP